MNQYYVTHNTGRNWFYITHCKICVICRTHQMSSEVMTHNIPLLLKMWFQIGGTNRVFKARLAPNKNCGLAWFKHKTLHNNFVGTGHREFLLLASFHISTNFGTHKSLTKSTTKTCSTKRQWKLVRKLCRVTCRWFGCKLFFCCGLCLMKKYGAWRYRLKGEEEQILKLSHSSPFYKRIKVYFL